MHPDMPRAFAFLRAINVGGRTVRMEQLRAVFERMGFAGVETFIASGNVVFDAGRQAAVLLERRIEVGLREALGYDVETFVRSSRELAEIVGREAFDPAEAAAAHAVYVLLLSKPLQAAARDRLLAAQTATDEFRVFDRDVYWLCRVPVSDSPLSGPLLGKLLDGGKATSRNLKTMRRLAAKYGVA
jgi:uncharacterized protein (DUF1697 family)